MLNQARAANYAARRQKMQVLPTHTELLSQKATRTKALPVAALACGLQAKDLREKMLGLHLMLVTNPLLPNK